MFAHPLRIVFSCLLLTTASTALAQVQQINRRTKPPQRCDVAASTNAWRSGCSPR